MPPPGRNFEHTYHETFEADKRELGLSGSAFDSFWRDVEANLDDDPFNVYVKEVPESEGFRVYPTAPAHPDIPSCIIYFSVERVGRSGKIHYYGVEKIPDDWVYVPLGL